jgi:hypothetical protein
MLPRPNFFYFLFQTSLLDWESWKINVKIGLEPLKGASLGRQKAPKKRYAVAA